MQVRYWNYRLMVDYINYLLNVHEQRNYNNGLITVLNYMANTSKCLAVFGKRGLRRVHIIGSIILQ